MVKHSELRGVQQIHTILFHSFPPSNYTYYPCLACFNELIYDFLIQIGNCIVDRMQTINQRHTEGIFYIPRLSGLVSDTNPGTAW